MLQAEHVTFGQRSASPPGRVRTARRPHWLFTENETNTRAALRRGEPGRRTSKTPSTSIVIHGRTRRGESRPGRHQGRRALPAGDPGRRRVTSGSASRLAAHGNCRRGRPWRGVRPRVPRPASRRPTSSTPERLPQGLTRRANAASRGRPTPGCSGASSSTTTSCETGSRAIRSSRRRPPAAPPGRNADWPHLLQPRRHLDARQVGVPLVRRLGPGVPHDPVRADRSRVRQAAARAASCASGTCTRTASCPPTSSTSATSTRPCTPGPAGASTR